MTQKRLEEKRKIIEQEKERLNQISKKWSFVRLILFLSAISCFIYSMVKQNYYVFFGFLLLLVLFFIVIYLHHKVSIVIRHQNYSLQVLQDYHARMDGTWNRFEETGERFVKNEEYFFDLDIVGKHSLFQYVNVCQTKEAKQALLNRFSNPNMTEAELLNSQHMIKELAQEEEFSIAFQASLKEFKEESLLKSLRGSLHILEEKVFAYRIGFIFTILLSIATIVTFFLWTMNQLSFYYFIGGFLVQLCLSLFFYLRNKTIFQSLSEYTHSLSAMHGILKVMEHHTFQNSKLQELSHKINLFGVKGLNHLKLLKDLDSFRTNIFTYLFVNGLFCMNHLLVVLFRKHQSIYHNTMEETVSSIEELEVLMSLAMIGQVKEQVCFPVLSHKVHLKFEGIKHPLLKETVCVENQYETDAGVTIITGSNMSGKTSFLRTIGINLILMNAGTFVHAKSFQAPYLKLFTSMRVTDDLSKGISTFYAELLRVKTAIQYQKQQEPMIVLIDEIFRGTNSNDRIEGAISLVRKLNDKNVIVLITTHDFELCEIKGISLSNIHFTEYYHENEIYFDYRLRIGKCQTTNAKHLMKLAGIIE